MYEIRIENLKPLQQEFAKSPKLIGRELEMATKKSGALILRTEKQEVPVRTAQLKRSITLNYRPIQVAIYPTVKYALPVHEGSKPHVIIPVRKKVLRFRIGGKWVYAKRVMHPGSKGNKFVERTVRKTTGGVNKYFDDVLDNIVKNFTK